MVLNGHNAPAPAAWSTARKHVIWHELECGGYDADLPLWRELAARADSAEQPGPILDVGAGTGRVTLELARHGHRVTAVDLDPLLLAELDARAADAASELPTSPRTIRADARTLELVEREFALCIVPMQTIQLFGGAAQRTAFLRRARAHLRPGGLLAAAIVTDAEVEPFDCARGDAGPSAESLRVGGTLFVTRALQVRVTRARIRIERQRRTFALEPQGGLAPGERDVIELDRLSAATLEHDGLEAGLRALEVRAIAPTDEHVGNLVVVFGA